MSKEDPGETVAGHEYLAASQRWNTFWRSEEGDDNNRSFSQFLGSDLRLDQNRRNVARLWLRRSAARKVRKLAGPHFYALLKAYQMRKTK